MIFFDKTNNSLHVPNHEPSTSTVEELSVILENLAFFVLAIVDLRRDSRS